MSEAIVTSWLATVGFGLLMLVSPGAINAAIACGIIAPVLTGTVVFELASDRLWSRRR